MVVTCDIEFDGNESGTYFAGQLVSGRITLKVSRPKEVNGILLKISGYAATQWSERTVYRHRFFLGREDYFSSLTYLLGSEQSNRTTLDTGVHTYTFVCQPPSNCPTSFEGLYGHVRYTVKVVLVRPWKFDQTYKRGFTVLKIMDLNSESPQLGIPSSSEVYRTLCCGPCTTEPLKLELKVPRTGYVPGESVPVTALVTNNTNIPITEVCFYLVMYVRYISQSPSRMRAQRLVVAKVRGDSVLSYCTRSVSRHLVVPPTPPTCLSACSIIKIAYSVEAKAKLKGLHKGQVVSLPLTIGTIPLATVDSTAEMDVIVQQPHSSRSMSSEHPADLSVEPSAPPDTLLRPNIPPPSYEESSHVARADLNADEQHTFGPCAFAPLYPVYNIRPTALPDECSNGGYVNKSFDG